MLAVLSPAKKLDLDPLPRPLPHTVPDQLDETAILLKKARRLSTKKLQALMSISPALAELTRDRFAAFCTPFTPDNAKPAALTFAGDTYVGLDAPSLSEDDLAWAQDHLGILSGLYGLLRPLDLVQAYRLEMGSKLANPRGGDLVSFWKRSVTDAINARTEGHPDRTVVNLASNEYFSAVDARRLAGGHVTPVFREIRDGTPKTISFLAKKARGRMARWIVQERITHASDLIRFDAEGYTHQPDASEPGRPVFTRPG